MSDISGMLQISYLANVTLAKLLSAYCHDFFNIYEMVNDGCPNVYGENTFLLKLHSKWAPGKYLFEQLVIALTRPVFVLMNLENLHLKPKKEGYC